MMNDVMPYEADYFENDRLALFTWPTFDDFRGLTYAQGTCHKYSVGDEVPWRTRWYDYGECFTVVNVKGRDEVHIHVFEDGRYSGHVVVDSKSRNAVDIRDFFVDNSVYNEHGRKLYVGTRRDFEDYVIFKSGALALEKCVNREYERILAGLPESEEVAKTSLLYLRNLAFNNSRVVAEVLEFTGIHDMLWDYGAYLHLAATTDISDELANSAQEYFDDTGFVLKQYFDFAKVPLTERSVLAKADMKLRSTFG